MICKNYDLLLNDLGVSNIVEGERFPKFFEIETVNACNARCIMCTVNEWNQKKSDEMVMSMELFQKFIDEIKIHKEWIDTVCLNRDGEPTLDKYLVQRVKMLKEVGIKKVTFSTNAHLLTKELSISLLEAGLDDIMISMDSIKKETFEYIRKKLSYEKVLQNILDFIDIRDKGKYKVSIRIRAIELEENKSELANWLNFWNDKINKQDRAYIMPQHSWGNQSFKEMEDKEKYYANIACISPFSTMVIHVNGVVPLCGCDYSVKYNLGDFSKSSIKDIWNGVEYNFIRNKHLHSNRNDITLCKGCNIWDREYKEIK